MIITTESQPIFNIIMAIEEFVKEAITGIVRSVAGASEELKGTGAVIVTGSVLLNLLIKVHLKSLKSRLDQNSSRSYI